MDALMYTKKRNEFGFHCYFDDVKGQILHTVEPTYNLFLFYIVVVNLMINIYLEILLALN